MTSQVINRREGGSASCPGHSRKLKTYTYIERARDHVGSSKTAWCADCWQGERLVQGWWWRGGHRSQRSLPSRPKYMKTAKKWAVSRTFWPKTPFFADKYLTRYSHETFFEECMNFETHYLSHCRVIPLQSFGSHIRPQPHGLGLTVYSVSVTETNCSWCTLSSFHFLVQ